MHRVAVQEGVAELGRHRMLRVVGEPGGPLPGLQRGVDLATQALQRLS